MSDRAALRTYRAIIRSHHMVEVSQHHLVNIKRSLRDAQAFVEAVRRDLDRWRRELRR